MAGRPPERARPRGGVRSRALSSLCSVSSVLVYVVVDRLSPTSPLGDSVEVFIRREDGERFVEVVRGDDPEVAAKLRIEERELEAGGLK